MQKKSSSLITDVFFLVFTIGLFYFALLGTRPLFVPDEGRYAEIAREMAESANYITPYLNGIKYFEKPILFYWLAALAIKIGGLNLWALRFINAFLALFGCIATYFTVYKLYDRKTALLSAFILSTSMLYFIMGHMISLDLPVTIFLTISLYAFMLAYNKKQRLYYLLAAIGSAFAVLTKGLIGIVFPVIIIFIWMIVTRQCSFKIGRYLLRILMLSVVVFLLVAVPWHILVVKNNPEFFYFYFIEQHFLRYTTKEIGHYQPIWYFIPTLLFGFFPWSVFLPQTLFKYSRGFIPRGRYELICKNDIFLITWALFIFIFFSFSNSKLIPYILPIFPPLAILVARYLRNTAQLGLKVGFGLLLFLSILFTVFVAVQHIPFADSASANTKLYICAVILTLGAITNCIFAYKQKFNTALKTTVVMSYLFLLTLIAAVPAIDTRTILPLAQTLQPLLRPQDVVITFNQYYQDLPFYLNRKVSILNWRNELTFGMINQANAREWMINDNDFWNDWHSNKRVFVVMANDSLTDLQRKFPQERMYVLDKTMNNVLISNREF